MATKLLMGILFTTSAHCQGFESYKHLTFDKVLQGTDKMIYMAPPPGKYWIITSGALSLAKPVPNADIRLWTETPPYNPYRNPFTGEMLGCVTCITIISLDASRTIFVPIVGGYTTDLTGTVVSGQPQPIIVAYPGRLMAAVSPSHGGLDAPVEVWVRLAVIERDLP